MSLSTIQANIGPPNASDDIISATETGIIGIHKGSYQEKSFFPNHVITSPIVRANMDKVITDINGEKHKIWIGGLPVADGTTQNSVEKLEENLSISIVNVFLTVPEDTTIDMINDDPDVCMKLDFWNYMVLFPNGAFAPIPNKILRSLCPRHFICAPTAIPDKNKTICIGRVIPILPPQIFLDRKKV